MDRIKPVNFGTNSFDYIGASLWIIKIYGLIVYWLNFLSKSEQNQ